MFNLGRDFLVGPADCLCSNSSSILENKRRSLTERQLYRSTPDQQQLHQLAATRNRKLLPAAPVHKQNGEGQAWSQIRQLLFH